MYVIRPARPDEAAMLSEIDRGSGRRFREVGLDDVADAEPASPEEYRRYADVGWAWVVVDELDRAVGFVVVSEVDGVAHIDQVSVIPEFQGQGLGRTLMERAEVWARERGRGAVTLTTFDHVPWNRPLYEHLGFRVLSAAEVGPQLRAILASEADNGLDPATRVAMRKDL